MAWHTRPVPGHSTRLTAIAIGAFATFAVAGGLAACGGEEVTSDAERFCGEAIAQRDVILTPPLGNEVELQATLDFYRLMGELAPVAIAEEWNDLVVNLETAASVVPGDPESEQLVAMTAYATEPSAFKVKDWLLDNCGVDIPITTIAPQEQVPAVPPTADSLAPTETSEGG